MTALCRRATLKAAIAVSLGAQGLLGRTARAAPKCATAFRIGAIRWDAWYDPGSVPGKATTASLSPPQYRFRLPFFAKINPDSSVEINGNSQSVMDQEIDDAADAGLAYWAFLAYAADSPMSIALNLYLQSARKARIAFCMMSGITDWAHPEMIARHIRLLLEPTYLTVLDGRPLFFLGPFDDAFVQRNWGGLDAVKPLIDGFRKSVQAEGKGNPYIVTLDQDAAKAAEYARSLGCDGVSAYAVNHNEHAAPFSRLKDEAEREWREHAATGLSVVPLVTTGFDRRPRIDHPPPWEKGPEYPGVYYDTATPEEIGAELRDCIAWMAVNKPSAPAAVALVYAWDENDEGGWLIPTEGGNHARLDAVKAVVCSE